MARDWDSGALREAMFLILSRYGPDDAKKFGKVLGDDLLNHFFRQAFELGWKAGQERVWDCKAERKVGVWTQEDFVKYLQEDLIPDLRSSNQVATAQDFETAIEFIE